MRGYGRSGCGSAQRAEPVNHVFVTQDFGPHLGGMARLHVELVRRFSAPGNSMSVSTVRLEGDEQFDRGETYPIHRQPFRFSEANRFSNVVAWSRWLADRRENRFDVLHCGNIRPPGYAVAWASARLGIPYMLYVYGGDLLREKRKARNALKRMTARRIFGSAAGIVAISRWVENVAREVMDEAGVKHAPPVGVFDLGTDPRTFAPERDTGRLRQAWGVGSDPLLLTVARLVPHKGQDTAMRALALLADEFPSLRYVLVGAGHDENRLWSLADHLGVRDKVVFAGPLADADLPEAYATSTIYVGPSRVDSEINAEGFGISFIEASSSGLPVVAGDSGGVRSAVRDGETGVVVPPLDVSAFAAAISALLRDPSKRAEYGRRGRLAAETHYNWDRVARDTREFTLSVIEKSR
jgi:phosphatidylinositol alpha-1,6-mannosyltransferase